MFNFKKYLVVSKYVCVKNIPIVLFMFKTRFCLPLQLCKLLLLLLMYSLSANVDKCSVWAVGPGPFCFPATRHLNTAFVMFSFQYVTIFERLFVYFWLSASVQSVACKLCLKWRPVMCQVGHSTLCTHSLLMLLHRCMLQSIRPVGVQSVVLQWHWIVTHRYTNDRYKQWWFSYCGQWRVCASVGNSSVQLDQVTQSVACDDRRCFTAAQSTGTVRLMCRLDRAWSCILLFYV